LIEKEGGGIEMEAISFEGNVVWLEVTNGIYDFISID
jgi:hypothetical protein